MSMPSSTCSPSKRFTPNHRPTRGEGSIWWQARHSNGFLRDSGRGKQAKSPERALSRFRHGDLLTDNDVPTDAAATAVEAYLEVGKYAQAEVIVV